MASKVVLIIKWKPQRQGEPTSHSFIYPHHLLFSLGLFKVIIMSLVMEDLGCSVVTCGKYYISTSNAHVVSLSEETHVISLELDHVPCGHLRLKSTGTSQGKKEKNSLNDLQRGKNYLDL